MDEYSNYLEHKVAELTALATRYGAGPELENMALRERLAAEQAKSKTVWYAARVFFAVGVIATIIVIKCLF